MKPYHALGAVVVFALAVAVWVLISTLKENRQPADVPSVAPKEPAPVKAGVVEKTRTQSWAEQAVKPALETPDIKLFAGEYHAKGEACVFEALEKANSFAVDRTIQPVVITIDKDGQAKMSDGRKATLSKDASGTRLSMVYGVRSVDGPYGWDNEELSVSLVLTEVRMVSGMVRAFKAELTSPKRTYWELWEFKKTPPKE